MTSAPAKSKPSSLARAIMQRTHGQTHGPVTRLMSPSDFGEILKPFVFLDLFDHEGEPFSAPLHPHSGIATLTYVAEGAVSFIDPDNVRGTLSVGGVEWMQAGRGMWHGGGLDKAGRTRGFQLWIALPSELELGPAISIYQRVKMYHKTVRRESSSAVTGPHPAPSWPHRRSTISRYAWRPASAGATSHRRATPSYGRPSHPARYRFPTSCGTGTWRLSSRLAKRSSSRRGPTLNLCSARPSRTSTISSSAPTRSTQRPPRCAMPGCIFRRFGHAWFKKAVCKGRRSMEKVRRSIKGLTIEL